MSVEMLRTFDGLRLLELHDVSKIRCVDYYIIRPPLSPKAVDALVGGAVDNKLTRIAKDRYRSTHKEGSSMQCIKDAYELPGRSFQITSFFKLDWFCTPKK